MVSRRIWFIQAKKGVLRTPDSSSTVAPMDMVLLGTWPSPSR
jgi:hypothetical protein